MKTWIIATIALTILVSSPLYAGKNAKMCRDKDGNPYFTDVGCPNDTEKVGTVYLPSAQGYSRQWSRGDRAMLQNHEQRIQKNLAARAASVQQQQQPTMTHEEARKRALDDAGYQKYGRLSKSQKDRVNEEMTKYNHLPPTQQQNASPRANNVGAIAQQQQQPTMTYEDARALATKDAGYQKYGQLSKSQKERVQEEMAKYDHRPPQPRQGSEDTTPPPQQKLLINGQPAISTGPNSWWDPQSGHYLQDAGGMVLDQNTGKYHLKQ